jgi:hypothetical protein
MTAPYRERPANVRRARDAAQKDQQIANEILGNPPKVPQSWLDVATERAGDGFASWPDIAKRMGLTPATCYGRWRRLTETTGHRRPSQHTRPEPLEYPDPLPPPEHGDPEWLSEYRAYLDSIGAYRPSRGTARYPDEVAS